jgi:hypothetical protein
MIIHEEFQQGSTQWYAARLGIPTASSFDKIITPARGEFSKSARSYCFSLVAELLLKTPADSISHLEWVARGKEMEPWAVKQYAFTQDQEVRPVGFVTTDDALVGASPDRLLVGRNGALEVKCPSPQVHLGYLIDGPGDAYKCQVQGQMYVAELDFVDFYSWHPAMPPVLLRVERDEAFICKLVVALGQFNALKFEVLERCRSAGFFDAQPAVISPVDAYAANNGD